MEKYIIPKDKKLIIDLPEKYIGKRTHFQIDIVETTKKKPSEFVGTVEDNIYDKFNKHLKKIKSNWE